MLKRIFAREKSAVSPCELFSDRAAPGCAGAPPAASACNVARTPHEEMYAGAHVCCLLFPKRALSTKALPSHACGRLALLAQQAGHLRSQGYALLTALLLLLASAYAQDAQLLAPGKALEATISGGQSHTYRITLTAGQFVHFDVQQQACNVALTLTAPDGKPALEVSVTGFGLPETMSEIVAISGEYQLVIRSISLPKITGKYQLSALVKDAPDERDRKRITAERLLLAYPKLTEPRQRLENAQQAQALWAELGERYWEAFALSLVSFAQSGLNQREPAYATMEQALAIAREIKSRASEASILNNLAGYLTTAGKREQAVTYYEQAAAIFRAINDKQFLLNPLGSLGDYYYSRAQYEKADGYYDQVLAIAQETGNRFGEAGAIRVKGMIAHKLKQYDQAQELLEQSLTMSRELKNVDAQSFSLRELGQLNLSRELPIKADEYFNQALQLVRSTGNRRYELIELQRVAAAYHSVYLDEKAMKLYEAALVIARELKDAANELNVMAYLGETYLNTSRLDQFLTTLEQRLTLSRAIGNKREQTSALSGFCFAYTRPLQKPEQGISYCEQALTMARENGLTRIERDALEGLSLAWVSQFQYEKAIDYLNQAIALTIKTEDRVGVGLSYFSLSALHSYLGQRDKGIEYAEKSLSNLKASARKLARIYDVLILLGDLYQQAGQLDKAIATHEEAVAFLKGSEVAGYESVAVQNLGYDYVKAGRYDKAIELFEAAQKVIGKHQLSQPFEWYGYLGSGEARRELKDYNRAFQDHLRSLLLSQQYPISKQFTGQVLEQLMKDGKVINNLPLAIFYGKQAINSYQEVRYGIRNLEKDLQQSFLKSKEQTYRELADLLISQGRLPEAEQVIRMLKEEEYFEYIRRDEKNAPRSEKASLTPEEAALDKRYREIAEQLTALGAERNTLLEKKGRTPEEEQRVNKLEKDLTVAAQVFQKFLDQLSTELTARKGREANIVQLNDSQAFMDDLRELGRGTVALYTVVTEDRFHVILTTSDVRKSYSYAIKAADLNRKVLDFRAALQNPKLDPLPLAQELYQILVAPLAKDLRAAQAETLMWSLDGVLRYMPMAALHDGEKYLVERWRNVVFTTASKARLKDEPSRKWNALGLGVTKSFGEKIPALPAVADEMHGIIREAGSATGVLPGVIKLDEQFTQEAMLMGLRQRPPVVHVASHFQFQPGNETDSALLLGDGNFLSLAQIKALTNVFSGVELLTLSACNTATGGSGANGKEIEGFGMLAQQKGAKAVVASLWPVADRSTKELMKEFYQSRETNGTTKAKALRQAQLKLLRGEIVMTIDLTKREIVHEEDKTANQARFKVDPKKPYAHPYYWAPFILIGNWK